MKKYLILIQFLIAMPILLWSQNYMFEDISYCYTKSKDSLNNEYIDTIFYKFKFKEKYLSEQEYLGRITFQCGLINDTLDFSIMSIFPRICSDTLFFRSHHSANIISVSDNRLFTFKVPVIDLHLKEINHANFSSDYSGKYYKENWNAGCNHEMPIYLGPLSDNELDRLSNIKQKQWIYIHR